MAIAGFKFIAAYQAMRDYGQYVQYHPPSDVTDLSNWGPSQPTTISGYSISEVSVFCGDTNKKCSSTPSNTANPKYYSYTATVPLSPMVLGPVLCGGGKTSCSIPLNYSEQFQ